jgi:peptidoglycan hydrolase CwlO-like protein
MEAHLKELQAENAKLQAELDDLNSPVQLSEWQKLQAEIAEMKAELHGTVTTEYHDQIVAEAMQLIAQLQALLKTARGSNFHWPEYFTEQVDQAIKEVE